MATQRDIEAALHEARRLEHQHDRELRKASRGYHELAVDLGRALALAHAGQDQAPARRIESHSRWLEGVIPSLQRRREAALATDKTRLDAGVGIVADALASATKAPPFNPAVANATGPGSITGTSGAVAAGAENLLGDIGSGLDDALHGLETGTDAAWHGIQWLGNEIDEGAGTAWRFLQQYRGVFARIGDIAGDVSAALAVSALAAAVIPGIEARSAIGVCQRYGRRRRVRHASGRARAGRQGCLQR